MGKIADSLVLYDRFLAEHRRVMDDPHSRTEEVWSSPEAGAEWKPEHQLPPDLRERLQEERFRLTVEISDGRLVSQLTPGQMRQGAVTIDYILNGEHSVTIPFELTPGCGPLVASAPLPEGFTLAERDPLIVEAIFGNRLVGFREIRLAEIGSVANAHGYFVSITRQGVAIGWATDRDHPDREVSLRMRVDNDFETVAFTQGQWTKASTVERRFGAKIPDRYADARLHRLAMETSGGAASLKRTPVYFTMNATGCLLISPVEVDAGGKLTGIAFNPWGRAEDKAAVKLRLKDGSAIEGSCDQPSPPAYDFLSGSFAFSLDPEGRGLSEMEALVFAEPNGHIAVEVPAAELIVTPEPWPQPSPDAAEAPAAEAEAPAPTPEPV